MARSYQPVRGQEPRPAPFGIVNPVTLVKTDPSDEEHWVNGISIDSLSCNASTRIVDICNTTLSASGTEPGDANQSFRPYGVQAEYKCSTFGFKAHEHIARAELALELCQSQRIENEFWTGALAQVQNALPDPEDHVPNKYLTDGSAVAVTGSAVKAHVALALLEQALAECGCGTGGTIHAPKSVATILLDKIKPKPDKDGVLWTRLGSMIIAGSGYPGTGPNGEAQSGTQFWMYATGPVSVFLGKPELSPDSLPEAVNVRNNDAVIIAERPAAATWDGCCHFAALVDVSLD